MTISIDDVFRAPDPAAAVTAAFAAGRDLDAGGPDQWTLRAPIGSQEVWAAGVTYEVSREARMAESAAAGGADVYARVYDAARPELFFKSTAERAVGPGAAVHIRADSAWNVPEPELVLAISADGEIFGYTAGNDVSSRDIEGENPLYLPQAKVYDAAAALGPGLVIGTPPASATVTLTIERGGDRVFDGATTTARIRRPFAELVEYLYREYTFSVGALLMTGAGVVPGDDFTLRPGDVVHVTIEGVGTLTNTVTTRAASGNSAAASAHRAGPAGNTGAASDTGEADTSEVGQ